MLPPYSRARGENTYPGSSNVPQNIEEIDHVPSNAVADDQNARMHHGSNMELPSKGGFASRQSIGQVITPQDLGGLPNTFVNVTSHTGLLHRYRAEHSVAAPPTPIAAFITAVPPPDNFFELQRLPQTSEAHQEQDSLRTNHPTAQALSEQTPEPQESGTRSHRHTQASLVPTVESSIGETGSMGNSPMRGTKRPRSHSNAGRDEEGRDPSKSVHNTPTGDVGVQVYQDQGTQNEDPVTQATAEPQPPAWNESIGTLDDAIKQLSDQGTPGLQIQVDQDDFLEVQQNAKEQAVRIYNALFTKPEQPPPNWSEEHQKSWKSEQELTRTKCQDRVGSTQDIKNTCAYSMLAVHEAVKIHKNGISVRYLDDASAQIVKDDAEKAKTSKQTLKTGTDCKIDRFIKCSACIDSIVQAIADNKQIALDLIGGKEDNIEALICAPQAYAKQKRGYFRNNLTRDTKKYRKSNKGQAIETTAGATDTNTDDDNSGNGDGRVPDNGNVEGGNRDD